MTELEYAFVVFTDLRGFTAWSATAQVAHHLQPFMENFYDIFREAAGTDNHTFLKPNGDGMLFVKSTGTKHELLNSYLDEFLDKTKPFIETEFTNLVQSYQQIMRCAIPLRLGFGINAGIVHRLEFKLSDGGILVDFASGVLNTAARLCDLARPAGAVISAEAFPGWAPRREYGYELVEAVVRNVSNLFPVWMPKLEGSDIHHRERRLVVQEFHVGIVCFDPENNCLLIAHRNSDRELYPGLWETGGGQIYSEEGIEDSANRIARTEFGVPIIVSKEAPAEPFKIEMERRMIPGVKLLCLFKREEYNGYHNKWQHLETRLVTLTEFLSDEAWPLDQFIAGTKDIVRHLINGYQKMIS